MHLKNQFICEIDSAHVKAAKFSIHSQRIFNNAETLKLSFNEFSRIL